VPEQSILKFHWKCIFTHLPPLY